MNRINSFHSESVLRLLWDGASREELLSCCAEKLQPIRAEDARKKLRYEFTLRTYLECGNDMVKTSRVLYIHRNTMVQRIRKINELLGTNVNLPQVRNELMNVFAILDYYESEQAEGTAADTESTNSLPLQAEK